MRAKLSSLYKLSRPGVPPSAQSSTLNPQPFNLASGLSDSVVSIAEQQPECPVCGSEARVRGGSCVSCLLRAGLTEARENETESFDDVLSAIVVRDTEWRLGNYQILEEIGRGGMGVIYRARQRHSKRVVALKRVLSYHGDSRETLERFRREAEAAASLDHPNILPIFEVSESEGLPYFTMKYATGGSLQQAAPALSAEPRECVRLLAKITRAVAYAHREGILHRDLKPGNILLDARGEPMVSDFGLAKWIDGHTDLTRSLTIFGTPGYIAPEQAQGPSAGLTPAADVYSLGAILFDLLTGRPPFLGEHALAVIHQAAEKPAPKVRSLFPKADRDLETICAKCLEREPKLRYRAAADLAEDLERWLEGRPIVARPVGRPAAAWRWTKRQPALATSLAVGLSLAALATAGVVSNLRLRSVARAEGLARRSLAVIPWEDMDALSSQSRSAKEITRSVSEMLGRDSEIKLRPHVQVDDGRRPWKGDQWQALAKDLDVRLLLTGTVRGDPSDRRIVFRVIDGATGAPLQTKVLQAGPDASNGEITIEALAQVKQAFVALADTEASKSHVEKTPARQLAERYVEAGKEYYYRYRLDDARVAVGYFEKAIAADDSFAPAQAMYALSAITLARLTGPESDAWIAKAEPAVARALQLDSESALVYRAAGVFQTFRGQFHAAQESSFRAIELDPADPLAPGAIAHCLRMSGQPQRAANWFQRCALRASRPGIYAASIGDCYSVIGDDDSAERAYRESMEFCPDLPDGRVGLAHLRLLQGATDEAHALARDIQERYPTHPYTLQTAALIAFFTKDFETAAQLYPKLAAQDRHGGASFYGGVSYLSGMAKAFRRLGRTAEADDALRETIAVRERETAEEPENASVLYDLAASLAMDDARERAVALLGRAIQAGWRDSRTISLDPRWETLHANPDFQRIIARSNNQ